VIALGTAPSSTSDDAGPSTFRLGALLAYVLLAVAGHAAFLSLHATGSWAVGFRPVSELIARWWAAAVLVFQFVIAALATRGEIRRAFATVGSARALTFVALWIAVSTLVARSPVAYGAGLFVSGIAHTGALLTWVAVGRALPPLTIPARLERFLPATAAIVVVIVAVLLNRLAFQGIPHVPDEIAYLFQARTYAAGRAFADAPVDPALFNQFLLMVHEGKWFSIFPPGWPMVLSLGVLAGAPWLVNPLLGGAVVLVTHRTLARWLEPEDGRLATILIALSPAFLVIAATHMSHMWSILCAMLCILWTSYALERRSVRYAAASGAMLGLLFMTRPAEGAGLALVVLAWVLAQGGRTFPIAAYAAAVVGGLVTSAPFFVNNKILVGHPLRDPIQLYFDALYYPNANVLGFGRNVGNVGWPNDLFPGHSPLEAGVYANLNLHLFDLELFGWSFGSLVFLLVWLWWGRRERPIHVFAGLAGVTMLVASLYWYSGADLGPRYWYQCLIPFVVLSIIGARAAARRLSIPVGRVFGVLALASLLGAPVVLGWRSRAKYANYRRVRADVVQLAAANRFGPNDIVLLRGGPKGLTYGDYSSAFFLNRVPIERGAIYVRDEDPAAVQRLTKQFPDRRVWIVSVPSVTGRGFEVFARP
jgi:hypothetical protein